MKRKLRLYHWTGMVLVLIGLAFVGLASIFSGSSSNASNPILGNANLNTLLIWSGDIIIVCAQIIVAIQMVIEEKFIGKFKVPPLQVGILSNQFCLYTIKRFAHISGGWLGRNMGSDRPILHPRDLLLYSWLKCRKSLWKHPRCFCNDAQFCAVDHVSCWKFVLYCLLQLLW